MFLSTTELAIIKADFEGMLRAADATTVTAIYRTEAFPQESPTIDPVFGDKQDQIAESEPITEELPVIFQLITPQHIHILQLGIVEIGEAILYFSAKVNFKEIVEDKPVLEGTLLFQDTSEEIWVPKNSASDTKSLRLIRMLYGHEKVCQAIPCRVRNP